jgi:hypothetical protein
MSYSKDRQKLNGFIFLLNNENVYFGKDDIYININQHLPNKHKTDYGYNETIQIVCKNIVDSENHEFSDVMNINCVFIPGMGMFDNDGTPKQTYLQIKSIESEHKLTPKTPKDEINFCSVLKDKILKTFSDKSGFPYITEIKIARNLFYK